ncbi:hypothetical protein [Streptomyces sp. NPDC055060]
MSLTPVTAPSDPARDKVRTEHDVLGGLDVQVAAYDGAHTARAVADFPRTGETAASRAHLILAPAAMKGAAARANSEAGAQEGTLATAIADARTEIREGGLLTEAALSEPTGPTGPAALTVLPGPAVLTAR